MSDGPRPVSAVLEQFVARGVRAQTAVDAVAITKLTLEITNTLEELEHVVHRARVPDAGVDTAYAHGLVVRALAQQAELLGALERHFTRFAK